MKFSIGSMTVGDILDRGIKLLLARLGTFYAIIFIVTLPVMIVQLIVPLFAGSMREITPTAIIIGLVGGIALLVFAFVLQQVGSGAICYVIAQEFVGRKPEVGEALNFAFGRAGNLVGAAFLFGLMLMLGFFLCFFPMFIFLTWYVFSGQVVVVEGLGAMGALERSKQLSDGHRWRILGVLLLLGVIGYVFGLLGVALHFILPYQQVIPTEFGGAAVEFSYAKYLVNVVFAFIVQALASSFQVICVTLLYFDLRIRKEGFDLELAAQKQTAGQPA